MIISGLISYCDVITDNRYYQIIFYKLSYWNMGRRKLNPTQSKAETDDSKRNNRETESEVVERKWEANEKWISKHKTTQSTQTITTWRRSRFGARCQCSQLIISTNNIDIIRYYQIIVFGISKIYFSYIHIALNDNNILQIISYHQLSYCYIDIFISLPDA